MVFSNNGFKARVSFNSEFGEYRVKFYRVDGGYIADADYFCEDKNEAIQTAQLEIARLASGLSHV